MFSASYQFKLIRKLVSNRMFSNVTDQRPLYTVYCTAYILNVYYSSRYFSNRSFMHIRVSSNGILDVTSYELPFKYNFIWTTLCYTKQWTLSTTEHTL